MSCCVLTPFVKEGDTGEVMARKKVTVALGVATMCFCVGNVFLFDSEVNLVVSALAMVAAAVLLCEMAFTKRLNYVLIEAFLYVSAVRLFEADLNQKADSGLSAWPIFVVFIDVCLVLDLPRRVARNLIIACMAWLVLTAAEGTLRFGLYDLPFLVSQSERRDKATCDTYPCKLSMSESTVSVTSALSVFLLDFYFTRNFAYGMRAEHAKMEAAISATEDIASSLSQFDLASADEVLSTAALPAPLDTAFRSILHNLDVYRPYLPDALFAQLHAEQPLHHAEVPTPGLSTGKVAIVFTDIQGSTATWEACPEGMREGLRVHNEVMRDCLTAHDGYEVKTIGDAFMVAFESVRSAVLFGLSVQEALVEAAWPVGILELEHCRGDVGGLWRGLRVRIGVHCGEVDVELNRLTGRYDYFGDTVNKAARLEGACIGGAVAVTDEVLGACGCTPDDDEGPEGCGIVGMGGVELKGVGGAVRVHLLVPLSLEGRWSFVKSQMQLKREDRCIAVEAELEAVSMSSHSIHVEVAQHRERASVGIVETLPPGGEPCEVTEEVSSVLQQLVTCCERTHGVIVSLQGSRVAVCWNGPRVCTTHVENSLVFARMIGVGSETQYLQMGISMGSIVCGAVGGRRQRFVAVLGDCVALSGVACSNAVQAAVLCYYAADAVPSCFERVGLKAREKGTLEAPSGREVQLLEVTTHKFLRRTSSIRRSQNGMGSRKDSASSRGRGCPHPRSTRTP